MKHAANSPLHPRLLLLALALPLAGCLDAGGLIEGDGPSMDPPALEDPGPAAPTVEDGSAAPISACHNPPEGPRLCWIGGPVDVAATLAVPMIRGGAGRTLIADADLGLHWLHVDADGEIDLQAIADLSLPAPATAGVVGDGDGDGDLDVALHTGERTFWVDPIDGGACDGVSYMPASPVLNVIAGDIDGDGVDNQIFPHAGAGGIAALSMFIDNQAVIVNLDGAAPTAAVAIGDIDGDAVADVLVADPEGGVLVFPYVTGAAALASIDAVTALPAGAIVNLLAADLDGDGDDDVIVHQRPAACDEAPCDDVISVILGAPTGLMPEPQGLLVGAGAGRPIVADVDGDGALDLAVAHADDAVITILLGDGVGSFRDRFDVTAAPAAAGARLGAGDLNGDGQDDLILAGGATPGLWLLLSQR